jgi:hypothetical protein
MPEVTGAMKRTQIDSSESTMRAERQLLMRDLFDLPDLYAMADGNQA